MDRVSIERTGGLAGLPAHGELDLEQLSDSDRGAIEDLFRVARFQPSPGADRFTYRLTRQRDGKVETLVVPEDAAPDIVRNSVTLSLPER